ncbi:MAG: hypothetical protein HY708_05325 [Ignavibacteriae bacterium]|nr:hypothetical protein [Ignavibacteriota bacterium]
MTRLIALSGESNFATDIATRAAVTGFQASGDRRMNFVSSLFSEAVDYLVSRDLPGYVGLGDRIKDVSSSIRFKQDIKRRVIEIVQGYPAPENVESTASEWRAYVGLISDALAKR